MTDQRSDIMRATAGTEQPTRRMAWLQRFGWPRRILAIVAVLSFAVALFAWVQVFSSAVGAITESPITIPSSTERTFSAGGYAVFERTGTSRGAGGITFTERDLPSLRPTDVKVTGPTGTVVPTRFMDSNETINQNGALYTGVVEFHITEPGRYHVQIDRVSGQAIVARSLLDGQGRNVVLGLLSGLTFAASAGALIISSIVVAVRRRRDETARWMATAAARPSPPVGWSSGPPAWAPPPSPAWAPPPPPPPASSAGPPPPPPPPPWRPDGT